MARRELTPVPSRAVARRTELLEFRSSSLDALLAVMGELDATGAGWVTLQARHPDSDEPGPQRPRAGVLSLFRGAGPALPVVTWVPGDRRRGEPDSLGIQHAAGPRAVHQVRDAGVPAPDGWRVLSDHPGRGLVLELPARTPPADVLAWALPACAVLSPVVLPDTWVAAIDRR